MRFASMMLCCFALAVSAEVTDTDLAGFSVQHKVTTTASPELLYAILTDDISQWWNADHSYSGKGENLSLTAKAGGCFCEQLEQGSVEHMRIVFADKGKRLRMMGGLGPLQSIAASGPLDWAIEPLNAGSQLTVTYHVSGYLKGGLQAWAAPVDQVIGEQVNRLKQLADQRVADGRD